MNQQTDLPDAPVDRPSSVRYVVLGWLCAAAAIAYIQRNSLAVLESTIRDDLNLDKEQMGWVLSCFFFTYAVFQIPSGWLGDRCGSRWALSSYSGLWSVATLMTILAGTFFTVWPAERFGTATTVVFFAWCWLLFSRLCGGAAQAGIFPCASVTMTHWFPTTQRGIASGWLAAFQQVGGILAAYLTGKLLKLTDWRSILLLYSIPGFIWAFWFYKWFRDQPRDHPSVNWQELSMIQMSVETAAGEQPEDETSQPTPWLALFSSPATWLICGQQFCRGFGYIFYASWFPTFLQETRNVSVPESGYLTSLPVLGSLLGALLGGTVSDKILNATGSRRWARQGVAIVGMLLCAIFIFVAYFVKDATSAVLIISAGAFCASLAGPAGYALTIDMGGKHVATVFATMNMSGNFGAFLFPIVVPQLLKIPGSWNLVLVVFGLVYVAAAACWALLNPNGTVFDQAKYGSKKQ